MDLGIVGISASVVTLLYAGWALVRYLRKRPEAQVVAAPRALMPPIVIPRQGPHDLQVLPDQFRVWLDREVPEIEIHFYGINYLGREVTGLEVTVTTFQLDRYAHIQNVSSGDQGKIPKRSSRMLRCQRPLSDSEIRILKKASVGRYSEGTVMVRARAFAGRKTVTYQPMNGIVIKGTIGRHDERTAS